MGTKTHWKKLQNPDYLGAYSLEPGEDLVLTIKSIKKESVTGPDGKKEECSVVRFAEAGVKPMVLNSTNSKIIARIYKTPYIEDWVGKQIQIYATMVSAYGERVEALRIRPFAPESDDLTCADCSEVISKFGKMNPKQMAAYTQKKYGRQLCAGCAEKAAQALKGGDLLDDPNA